MQKHEVDIAVQSLYTELSEDGSNPLTIAASFMVSAFLIYSSELPREDYLEVMCSIFDKANIFIEKRYSHLN
jgi:hypothetical protein